jgi:hypothetical protein
MATYPQAQVLLSTVQKAALKIFLPAPIVLAILFGGVVASSAPLSKSVIFFSDVAAASLAVATTIMLSADWFARRTTGGKLQGILYGIALLVIGAAAFCIPNWFFFENCTLRTCLFVPLGWICFYGWPVAAFCGLLFSGACNYEHRS